MNTEQQIKYFEQGIDTLKNSRYNRAVSYILFLASTKGVGVEYANKIMTFFLESI